MTSSDLVLTPMGLRAFGRVLPCTWGRGGLSRQKREGDGATPKGVHGIIGMLYRPDRIPSPVDWAVPIGPQDLWSDDPDDAEYNKMVRAPYAPSHERLKRADRLYDLVILTNWNWPIAHPGQGSAIFIHRWRGPGQRTEGCVALPPEALLWVAQRLTYSSRLIVP